MLKVNTTVEMHLAACACGIIASSSLKSKKFDFNWPNWFSLRRSDTNRIKVTIGEALRCNYVNHFLQWYTFLMLCSSAVVWLNTLA